MTGPEEFITDREGHMRLENDVFQAQSEPGGVTHV